MYLELTQPVINPENGQILYSIGYRMPVEYLTQLKDTYGILTVLGYLYYPEDWPNVKSIQDFGKLPKDYFQPVF